MHNWYALTSKPQHEKSAAQVLLEMGFESFVPLYADRRKWSDRVKLVEFPLFPRYVFCRFRFPEQRGAVLHVPGILSIVKAGSQAAPVDEQEMIHLQTTVRSGLEVRPHQFLKIGQWVELIDGPLRGVEGILVDVENTWKVIVSVTLLQRSVSVSIERKWVKVIREPSPFAASQAGSLRAVITRESSTPARR